MFPIKDCPERFEWPDSSGLGGGKMERTGEGGDDGRWIVLFLLFVVYANRSENPIDGRRKSGEGTKLKKYWN